MYPSSGFSNWVEVDLHAVDGNVRRLAAQTGGPVMAVVKANGYGHGLIEVARAAAAAGAHSLGVARLEEALALRAAELRSPILVLGGIPDGRWGEAVADDVQVALWSQEQFQAAAAAARKQSRTVHVQLKVDTGMSRLGVDPESAFTLASMIAAADGVVLEGVFTHFARADEPDPSATETQLAGFQSLLGRLESKKIRPPLAHAANSAAAIRFPEARFDLVRSGVGILGLDPSEACRLPEGFQPALTWKARLSLVRVYPPGTGVGYGHAYVTTREERIGVVPVGYGDGYRRSEGNVILVGGRRVPVVGRVCMDQVMVLLEDVPEAARGDEAVLIGEQGGEAISAGDLARAWGTISYEVVCGIAARVPRVYAG
ncbi:MAG: alanine racemase [Anaerolineales bacterium]